MDRLDQLNVFVRIAECGSFAQAADHLGLPRATVSGAVQQLEARLGTRLLHRTTRRVSLTPDGEALLERAQSLVADAEDLELQFRPGNQGATGRLRVDVPSRVARRLIAPALPQFLALHPGIELELGSSDRMIDLVLEGVDCALRVGPLANNSLVARPLGQFALINCASPAYLARHGTPQQPADLAVPGAHQEVHYLSPGNAKSAPWEWVSGGQRHTLNLPGAVAANNAETYIACALAGLGLIQVPAYDVREHLAAGELVEVMPDARAAPMSVHLVYPHRRHLALRVRVFSGWLQTLLGSCLDAPAR